VCALQAWGPASQASGLASDQGVSAQVQVRLLSPPVRVPRAPRAPVVLPVPAPQGRPV
jgi:hypothetical protein